MRDFQGSIWSGGFHYPHAPMNAKPLCQAFFYPNETSLPYPQKVPLSKPLPPTPFEKCRTKINKIFDLYSANMNETKTLRRFSNRIGHLLLILENVETQKSQKGHVTGLSAIPTDFKTGMKSRLKDISQICFNRIISERYKEKKNKGKHLVSRSKKIFKHLCKITNEDIDDRFCRRKNQNKSLL